MKWFEQNIPNTIELWRQVSKPHSLTLKASCAMNTFANVLSNSIRDFTTPHRRGLRGQVCAKLPVKAFSVFMG
jgi:hypothetical protein